jgi:hypothetical protein
MSARRKLPPNAGWRSALGRTDRLIAMLRHSPWEARWVLSKMIQISAFAHAITRVGIGTAFLLAPKRTAEPWIGASYDTPGGRALLQAFAARDILIGGAQLSALTRGSGARTLFRWGLLAEAVDLPAAIAAQKADGAARPVVMNALGGMGLLGGAFLSLALPAD